MFHPLSGGVEITSVGSGNISRSPLLMKIYRSTGSFALAPLVGLRNTRAARPSLTSWASENSRTAIYNARPDAVSTSHWCSYPRDVFLISISVAHALPSITSHHRYKSEFGGFIRPHLTLFSTTPLSDRHDSISFTIGIWY